MSHEFPAACGLPERWRGKQSFTVLEVGVAPSPNFLATWDAWRRDPLRCGRLHYVGAHAQAGMGADLAAHPLRAEFTAEFVRQLPAPLLPGLHRLVFEQGDDTLILTLAIGNPAALLPQLRLAADAIFMDDAATPPELFKAVARLARPRASIVARDAARKSLGEAGFVVAEALPAAGCISGEYAPSWPRPAGWPGNAPAAPDAGSRHAIVVGAGIAGACTAYALSTRGWQVTLLDEGSGPGAGASGLPIGLMVPHVSPDDAPMSRLTRAGCEMMRALIDAIALDPGHWRADGVLQRVDDAHKARAPASWGEQHLFELREAAQGGAARFFPRGAAIEPGALVRQLLAKSPGLRLRWRSKVHSLARSREGWAAQDGSGSQLAAAPVVIVCAALDSLRIAGAPSASLRPVRGQVTLGGATLPAAWGQGPPLSGNGHFIPGIEGGSGPAWVMGASFERGETEIVATEAAHAANLEKLRGLSPGLASLLAPAFDGATAKAWVGVRCTSPDRLPLVGPVRADLPGVFMLAALGSRGLSLAAVCAELLACQLNDEPWPVMAALGEALSPARFA